MVYSELPGGVRSTHASSLFPSPSVSSLPSRPPRSAAAAHPTHAVRSRQALPRHPTRSHPVCSISTRVRVRRRGNEGDLHSVAVGGSRPMCHEVGEAARRSQTVTSPHRARAGRGALVDPASGSGLEDHLRRSPLTVWSRGHQVPIRDVHVLKAWSDGQSTSKLRRSGDVTDCGGGAVFSANNRKRAAASPHTPLEILLNGPHAATVEVIDPPGPVRPLSHQSRHP